MPSSNIEFTLNIKCQHQSSNFKSKLQLLTSNSNFELQLQISTCKLEIEKTFRTAEHTDGWTEWHGHYLSCSSQLKTISQVYCLFDILPWRKNVLFLFLGNSDISPIPATNQPTDIAVYRAAIAAKMYTFSNLSLYFCFPHSVIKIPD